MFIEQRSYYELLEQERREKRHKRLKPRRKLKQLVCIFFALCAGITIISRYVVIVRMSYANEELSRQYSQIVSQNKELEANLARAKDLQRIESIAVNRLGMVKPDETQIVYVKVPKARKGK
ncbi:septum formation initiator family protein [Caldanaerobius polysaccharolyticus]|uniref:septum formation initiator family protein n=1 Tax=Caldanaerobius polysaccharolyticus TaxID=44256 RepID=UPI00047C9E23|nr:septum formation initiator family protein [Caldanaerobius polysaccharolyticus]